MARRKFGKAIGARSARKLIREIGGTPDSELAAEWERTLGHSLGPRDEIFRLLDGRVLHISWGSANIYSSVEEVCDLLKLVKAIAARGRQHPLEEAFPRGYGFIEAVPRLLAALPGKLDVNAGALNRSVVSLELIDKAARRLGGQQCLDDSAILAPIVAYTGEVVRQETGGRWVIRNPGAEGKWQAVIVGANGRDYRIFIIFKELLERGSVRGVIDYEIARGRF
jgi:hypothetical protein